MLTGIGLHNKALGGRWARKPEIQSFQDDSLVQYATGGMDQQLFVSQYLVKLPSEETLKALIQRQSIT